MSGTADRPESQGQSQTESRSQTESQAHSQTEALAAFATHARYDAIPERSRADLRRNLLDALGCAVGALDGEPIRLLRQQLDAFGGAPLCTLVGGGRSAPDRAAAWTTALTRYLDFMDNFLAKGETCHPSDNIGSVLAAADFADAAGRDFLAAMAVAYQVEIRLTEEAPIMARGFDHTTQLAFSIAAGVSRALGLTTDQAADALGACGSDFGSLAVIRAAPTTQWKGLASSATAFAATHATFLASRGISAPRQVLEGPKGLMAAIGKRFSIDWAAEPIDGVSRTSLKRYNAEVHTQTAIEAVLRLRAEHGLRAAEVDEIEAEVFLAAYQIVGGGEYGDRSRVATKEEADHSLPYVLAVALLDGDVGPAQYRPERIKRADVQELLRRIRVTTSSHLESPAPLVERVDPFTRAYPDEMPARIRIRLRDGRSVEAECRDYPGFVRTPMGWEQAVEKFERLASRFAEPELRRAIVQAVDGLDGLRVRELTELLGRVSTTPLA
ncbi:MAG TPA: MmgE/PrpD family protein [Candidatus Limnocylindrales bacterium]